MARSNQDDRRTEPRKRVESGLSLVDFGTENGGLILDLSEGGLAMQAVYPVEASDNFPVSFELPNTRKTIRASASIAWKTPDKQVGLRFADIPAEARQQIREWLAEADVAVTLQDAFMDAPIASDLPGGPYPWEPGGAAHSASAETAVETLEALEDLPSVYPIENSPQKTVRYYHDFSRTETSDLQANYVELDRVQKLAISAEQTIRYVPQFEPSFSSTTARSTSVRLPLDIAPQKLDETPKPMTAANTQELRRLVGSVSAAERGEALQQVWRWPGFLEHFRSLPPAGRKRMLYELDFQSRALSLWFWEIEGSAASASRKSRG